MNKSISQWFVKTRTFQERNNLTLPNLDLEHSINTIQFDFMELPDYIALQK